MLTKAKKGENNNSYCTLKLDQRMFRTRTIRHNAHPVWNEQFFFDINNFDGTIKIHVWHEEEGLFKGLGQEDSFLGKIEIPLASLQDPKKVQSEEWFELQKRSDKSHVAGQLRIKVYFARFDQTDTIIAPDYHSMYDILATKVAVAVRAHPELCEKGKVFLEEFGKRYGVRGLYRLVK